MIGIGSTSLDTEKAEIGSENVKRINGINIRYNRSMVVVDALLERAVNRIFDAFDAQRVCI